MRERAEDHFPVFPSQDELLLSLAYRFIQKVNAVRSEVE